MPLWAVLHTNTSTLPSSGLLNAHRTWPSGIRSGAPTDNATSLINHRCSIAQPTASEIKAGYTAGPSTNQMQDSHQQHQLTCGYSHNQTNKHPRVLDSLKSRSTASIVFAVSEASTEDRLAGASGIANERACIAFTSATIGVWQTVSDAPAEQGKFRAGLPPSPHSCRREVCASLLPKNPPHHPFQQQRPRLPGPQPQLLGPQLLGPPQAAAVAASSWLLHACPPEEAGGGLIGMKDACVEARRS